MSYAVVLDQKLRSQVQTERKVTHQILLTIQEMDTTQCFRELGHSSLFDYLVRAVGYSESAAHRRISAARLIKQCPEVATKIQQGKINLSQLALVQSAIKQEERKTKVKVSIAKQSETLMVLEGKNNLETQQALLSTFTEFIPHKPHAVPTKDRKIRVNLEFSEQEYEKVKDLLAQMSHKVPDQKIESALIYWATQLEKKKLKAKEEKITAVALKHEPSVQRSQNALPIRKPKIRNYISVTKRRQVFQEGHHQCQYVSPITNERCTSKHFLELEHAVPLALGGTDEISNLRIMCRSHNALMAKQMHISRPHSNPSYSKKPC